MEMKLRMLRKGGRGPWREAGETLRGQPRPPAAREKVHVEWRWGDGWALGGGGAGLEVRPGLILDPLDQRRGCSLHAGAFGSASAFQPGRLLPGRLTEPGTRSLSRAGLPRPGSFLPRPVPALSFPAARGAWALPARSSCVHFSFPGSPGSLSCRCCGGRLACGRWHWGPAGPETPRFPALPPTAALRSRIEFRIHLLGAAPWLPGPEPSEGQRAPAGFCQQGAPEGGVAAADRRTGACSRQQSPSNPRDSQRQVDEQGGLAGIPDHTEPVPHCLTHSASLLTDTRCRLARTPLALRVLPPQLGRIMVPAEAPARAPRGTRRPSCLLRAPVLRPSPSPADSAGASALPPSASHDLGETRAGSSGDCFPTGRRPGRGRERTLLALGAWAPGGLRRPRPTPPAHWPRLRAGARAKEALVPSPARVPFPPVAIREFAPCPPGRGGREDRGADPAEGCDALPSLPEGSSSQDRPSLPAREGLGFPEKTSLIRRNGLLGAAPSSSCGPRRGCPSETRRSRLCPDAARHLPAGFPRTPESNAREGKAERPPCTRRRRCSLAGFAAAALPAPDTQDFWSNSPTAPGAPFPPPSPRSPARASWRVGELSEALYAWPTQTRNLRTKQPTLLLLWGFNGQGRLEKGCSAFPFS
ncbi:WAS/WASL-interacting protein family member 1-like [Hylobates moloch]|uniref:WAS/WASL-interacting protein family member 1-like n=1 Tax=Hylobates moloch TaxID=81572 RepID=UPI002675C32A|nr:WAS/WASL-interacting protein family member 1-like [Hylobates moloch]